MRTEFGIHHRLESCGARPQQTYMCRVLPFPMLQYQNLQTLAYFLEYMTPKLFANLQ